LSASDSWPKLEAGFRQLSESEGDFHATGFTGQWILSGAPGDNTAQELLHERFESMARLAGIKAGVPNRSNARDGWLNVVSEECPHLTIHRGVVINRPCLASAEACQRLERREIELETIAASAGPYGLRRDMYPRPTWLYDHSHESLGELDAELQYWGRHVWAGFRRRVNHFERIIEERKREGDPARPDCSGKLDSARVGLSYDLAVLRANHYLDLGLRGEDAIGAFRNEEAPLVREIESAWLASCEMLELSPAEEAHPDFARPFARVREHLAGLLEKISSRNSVGDAPPPGIVERPKAKSAFWKERQAEFEKYAVRYADLSAHWRAAFGKWVLWWGSKPDGHRTIPQECVDLLNAIARKAITRLPSRHPKGDEEPWHFWIDFLRERRWGFRVTGTTACTEQEWDAGVKEGKPLVQVRKEQKYTTHDEWKKVYKRTKSGELRRLSARELKGKNSEDLSKYYHWLEDGIIDHVFQASADLCEDLAARDFQLEATASAPASTEKNGKAEQVSGSPTSTPPPGRRKRGRPQTKSDSKKTEAARLKASGGTNRQAAALIYDTQYPTTQQVKNVPSILRHFHQKSTQSGSPVKPREASPKPRKTRG
jgi:hypothetical protein